MLRFLSQTLILVTALSISACASVPDRNPIPADLKASARICGMEEVRIFADVPPPGWDEWLELPREVLKEDFPALFARKQAYLAVAASGQPGAKALIHKVLRASASIPGVFPPVYFDFDVNGNRYDEIHVDGGTTSQVFLCPTSVDWRVVLRRLEVPGTPQVYIIRNSPLKAPSGVLDPAGIMEIAGKSVSSLIRTQGNGDLYTIYYALQRDGLDCNLAYVPPSFELEPEEPFDKKYMRALFDVGYQLARDGYPWEHAPPGVQAPEAIS